MVWALTYMVTQYAWFYGFNPGADLTLALLIVAIPFAFLLLIYWAIGVIMPRSGSDYVWVSRIFHPSIGFAWSVFYMFVVFATSIVSQLFTYTYLLASAFTTGGFLYNAPSLTDIGNSLSSPIGTFSFSVLLTIIFTIFAILGAKLIKGLLYVSWATAIVGVALMWWLLATTDPPTFAAKWNSVMTGYPTYEALQDNAVKAGWTPPVGGWSAVFGALPLAALFYMGSQYGANVILGEVKGVRKTVPISLFLSVLLGWIFWSLGGFLTLKAVGANWLYAVAYSWEVQPSSYLLPFPPAETLFLSVIAYPNALLIGLIFFTWLFGSIQALFVYFWAPSRYLFAWAFDRIIPTRFADVGRRFHTPHVAIIALAVLCVVELWLYAFAGFPYAFALGTFLWVVAYVVPGLATVVFPFTKKDLLEQAGIHAEKGRRRSNVEYNRIGHHSHLRLHGVHRILEPAHYVPNCNWARHCRRRLGRSISYLRCFGPLPQTTWPRHLDGSQGASATLSALLKNLSSPFLYRGSIERSVFERSEAQRRQCSEVEVWANLREFRGRS